MLAGAFKLIRQTNLYCLGMYTRILYKDINKDFYSCLMYLLSITDGFIIVSLLKTPLRICFSVWNCLILWWQEKAKDVIYNQTVVDMLHNQVPRSTQLGMNISLVINIKMSAIVGIFIFIGREIFMLSYVSKKEFAIVSILRFIHRTRFILFWVEHEKKVYNFGA